MATTMGPYYIGSVKRAPHRGDSYHYASVEPLVESDPTGTKWLGPVQDAMTRFPNRGLVHWHDALPGLQTGSLWQFTIDEHPYAERGERPEQYQAQDPRQQIEILDLRGWSDEAALRSTITGDGIPLTPAPLARRVLLWVASDLCVGPLVLKSGTAPGLWTIDAPEAHRDAARMPVWHLSDTDINPVHIDGGRRWFVSPLLELGQSAGIQNWMSDAMMARSILGRLRKMDPDLVKAIGATDNLFREYLDHVESGRMGTADPAVERARADRLRGFREAIERDAALLTEAGESLLATEGVRTELERQVQAKIAEVVRARQTDVDAALAGAQEQLSRLEERLAAKRAEDAELDAVLLDKRRELDATVASFDQEVTARLEEIARRPAAFFAETAALRAVLAPNATTSIGGGTMLGHAHSSARPPKRAIPDSGEAAPQLVDDEAVRRALAAHASAGALSLHAILGLHAAFVAGTSPVVAGWRGYDLLHAYASAAAGGRLHWIPIASSTMEPHDLLGRFDTVSGRILPSPTGLLDVVRDATQSDRLHVIVLQGFNRAPSEAYLSPILEAVLAARVGDVLRAFPLAHPGLVAEDDAYRDVARLAWPPTVLVACLPTDGSVTLPVPPSVWRFVALLDADDRDRPPLPSIPSGTSAPALTEISPALWKNSVTAAQRHAALDGDEATMLARALSLSTRDAGDATRVREVLCVNGVPPADATALAFAATMIARSGAEAKAIEDAMKAVGVALPGWRTVWAESQRLRT